MLPRDIQLLVVSKMCIDDRRTLGIFSRLRVPAHLADAITRGLGRLKYKPYRDVGIISFSTSWRLERQFGYLLFPERFGQSLSTRGRTWYVRGSVDNAFHPLNDCVWICDTVYRTGHSGVQEVVWDQGIALDVDAPERMIAHDRWRYG